MLNNQEQNQKDLNDVYCVFVEDDSLVTTNQINYLHNLAQMCPFTEGLSVYEARGLMRTWDDCTFYYNSCENNIPEEFNNNNSRFASADENGGSDILIVYPNPTSGELNIVSKNNSEQLVVVIKDATGKVITQSNLQVSDFISNLTLNLENGLYLITITNNKNESITKKLVIAK